MMYIMYIMYTYFKTGIALSSLDAAESIDPMPPGKRLANQWNALVKSFKGCFGFKKNGLS